MSKDPTDRNYLEYVSLGAELAIALSAPILLGYWLDLRWGTSPSMLLSGSLLGFLFIILIFIKMIRDLNEK